MRPYGRYALLYFLKCSQLCITTHALCRNNFQLFYFTLAYVLLILSHKTFQLVKYKEEASKMPCGPFGAKPVKASASIVY